MLVKFIKHGFGLLCSLWKRVLHALVFHSGCLIVPRRTEGCGTQRPHRFILSCVSSFYGGVLVSSLLRSDQM